jgi:hypothetical protein
MRAGLRGLRACVRVVQPQERLDELVLQEEYVVRGLDLAAWVLSLDDVCELSEHV